MEPAPNQLAACPACGLVHRLDAGPAAGPPVGRPHCTRCDEPIPGEPHPRSSSRAAALAATALVIYPLAVTLPFLTISRFGHDHAASVWGGAVAMLAEGEWVVGLTVFLFSVVTPVFKLAAMFALGFGAVRNRAGRGLYTLVEIIGKWGMLDVLLVAVLVAALKLGDLVSVTPGVGVVPFLAVVVLSLCSSAAFDPRAVWQPSQKAHAR